jgi:hypothetical protein
MTPNSLAANEKAAGTSKNEVSGVDAYEEPRFAYIQDEPKPSTREKPRHATTNGVADVAAPDPANAGFLQHMRTVHLPMLPPMEYPPAAPTNGDSCGVVEFTEEFPRFRSGNEFLYTDEKCFYAIPEHFLRPNLPPLPIHYSLMVWRCTILHEPRSIHVLPFCDTMFDAQRFSWKLVDRLRSEYPGYPIVIMPIQPRYCYIPHTELQHSPPLIPAPVAAVPQAGPVMQGESYHPSESHLMGRHICE